MRCVLSQLGAALTVAGACLVLDGSSSQANNPGDPNRPGTAASTTVTDSVYTLPAIVVRARRPEPQEILDRLPGQVSIVEIAPLRQRVTTTAEILDELPGVHVNSYGGLGAFSTVSIRGCASNQVSVYLDGIPLARAGLGVVNLSELPFAALERVEVYRGFAPPEFPGASLGGAINLVTRAPGPPGSARSALGVLGGVASFETRRVGGSQQGAWRGWDALFVADHLESSGDFLFLDDRGTNLEPGDDAIVPRRNNWMRGEEVLAKVGRALPGRGELRVVNQWLRRRQGVPGISSNQSGLSRAGTTYDLTSLEARLPALWRSRLQVQARAYHDWRRDVFTDPEGKIGLGYQNNSDVTRAVGGHLSLRAFLPLRQQICIDTEASAESFQPWRSDVDDFTPSPEGGRIARFSPLRRGPLQRRTALVLGLEDRVVLFRRFDLHAGVRFSRLMDRFAGDLRNAHSQRAPRSGRRDYRDPRLGARLEVLPGAALKASWGRYHRTPSFLELFGDGGGLVGRSDLLPERGTNRDYGAALEGGARGLRVRFEFVRFENRADHLITFEPRLGEFVAANIGSARTRGEEWSWRLAQARALPRWSMHGNYTHQRGTDLGIDRSWYAGNALPLRPEHQLFQRLALRFAGFELGWEYEFLGRNFVDRLNSARRLVPRRDLHGLDVRAVRQELSLQLGVRNLFDRRAADVAGFPLPGRTVFATTGYRF